MTAKLNLRQERFVVAYLEHGNGTRAAIEAGYSAKTAEQGARQLLRKTNIAEAIDRRRAKLMEKLEITTEDVLKRYERWAGFDLRKLYDADGKLKPIRDLDEETAAGIAEIDIVKKSGGETIQRVKLVDRLGANNSLARCLGMFRDRVELNVPGALAAQLDAARKRVGRK